MNVSTLLIGAGIGALAGLLGYLAAVWAQRRWYLARLPYWVVVVSAAVGIVGGTALIDQPWLIGGEAIAVDNVLPYMRLVKANEPALYERIETSVVRDQEDGMSADQVRANAKALVMSFVADAATSLPDQLTYELFVTTRDQLAYLASREDYPTCADVARGHPKGDLDAKLSKDLVDRGNSDTIRVIAARAEERKRKPPSVFAKMPAEEFTQLASRSFAEASHATGVPPEDVDGIIAGTGDDTKTCRLMKAFLDSVLAQPVEVAAAALRTLASGEPAASP